MRCVSHIIAQEEGRSGLLVLNDVLMGAISKNKCSPVLWHLVKALCSTDHSIHFCECSYGCPCLMEPLDVFQCSMFLLADSLLNIQADTLCSVSERLQLEVGGALCSGPVPLPSQAFF